MLIRPGQLINQSLLHLRPDTLEGAVIGWLYAFTAACTASMRRPGSSVMRWVAIIDQAMLHPYSNQTSL
jgi:hypothetical protein